MQIIINNEGEMEHLGATIAPLLQSKDTVYLIGTLGAGKTTLVRGIARGMGYSGRVTSPTFTIMNIYQSTPVIYHFDFYRLDENSISDIGLDDYIEKDGIVLIEWPEAGGEMLPREALFINIELVNGDYEQGRMLTLKGQGERYRKLVEEMIKRVDTGCRQCYSSSGSSTIKR